MPESGDGEILGGSEQDRRGRYVEVELLKRNVSGLSTGSLVCKEDVGVVKFS